MRLFLACAILFALLMVLVMQPPLFFESFSDSKPSNDEGAFFRKRGVLLLPESLDDDAMISLMDVSDELVDGLKTNNYSLTNAKGRRQHNVVLEPTDAVRELVDSSYDRVRSIVGDVRPMMIELACDINFPYSDLQPWYRALPPQSGRNRARYVTVGVALDDLTEQGGAMQFLPGSHLADASGLPTLDEDAEDAEDEDDNLRALRGYFDDTTDHFDVVCKRGSIILWDGAILRRWGANRASSAERIFYYTLLFDARTPPNRDKLSIWNSSKFVDIDRFISPIRSIS